MNTKQLKNRLEVLKKNLDEKTKKNQRKEKNYLVFVEFCIYPENPKIEWFIEKWDEVIKIRSTSKKAATDKLIEEMKNNSNFYLKKYKATDYLVRTSKTIIDYGEN